MEIKTQRLLLRDIKKSDYRFYAELESNESCLQYESDSVPTKEEIEDKFNKHLNDKNVSPRTRYSLMIENAATQELVGRVVLWEIDDSIKEWEMGWYVHPRYWGKGYAPEAARALLMFAFSSLKAHRVQALCNDKNINSEKVMLKIGMLKEGTCRGVRFLNNEWYGSHIYALLENELTHSI